MNCGARLPLNEDVSRGMGHRLQLTARQDTGGDGSSFLCWRRCCFSSRFLRAASSRRFLSWE